MTIQSAPEETPNAIHVRELRRGIATGTCAKVLYAWARELWPDHPDYPLSFAAAPPFVQTRMLRLALQALSAVNEAAERDAERLAECSLDDSLNECEADALVLDADHSRRDLIEAAFLRLRQNLQRQKPIQAALSIYRQSLEKGGR